MRILVTGSAGLVGTETMEHLAREEASEVVGVTRRPGSGQALAWDIGAQSAPPELQRQWDAIVNVAADVRWTMSADEAQRANVATVEALAPLVSPDTHVVHVSTAYAVGLRGDATSADLGDYRNTYEWSKAAAERLARELFPRLTIVRPPLVIGRRSDGRAARFAGMYMILRGMASSIVPAVVATGDAFFEVVPVDDVAGAIAEACGREGSGEVLTLGGGEAAPRVQDALEILTAALNEWRATRGLEPFPATPIVTPSSWERFFLPFVRQHLTERQLRILELLDNFLPYLAVSDPLEPTHLVEDMEPCIARSVRYWADSNRRLASSPVRPWELAA